MLKHYLPLILDNLIIDDNPRLYMFKTHHLKVLKTKYSTACIVPKHTQFL